MTMFLRNFKVLELTPEPAAAMPAPDAFAPAPPAQNRRFPMTASNTPSSPSVSVIGKALKITGQLESAEDIHIEGEVEGDVRGVSVRVGQGAKIHGTIYGEEVEISGNLDGKIEARKVVLTSTAHVSGDLVYQEIRIELGAFIDGRCRPEFGKPDGKTHGPHKPAASNGNARPANGTTKAEVRPLA